MLNKELLDKLFAGRVDARSGVHYKDGTSISINIDRWISSERNKDSFGSPAEAAISLLREGKGPAENFQIEWDVTYDGDNNTVLEAPSPYGDEGSVFYWRIRKKLTGDGIEWYMDHDTELLVGDMEHDTYSSEDAARQVAQSAHYVAVAEAIEEMLAEQEMDDQEEAEPDPGELNLDVSPDQARALHRVCRAMHDGDCPNCGVISDSMSMVKIEVMTNGNDVKVWRCPHCKFEITEGEMHHARSLFRPYMQKSLDVFEQWSQSRGQQSNGPDARVEDKTAEPEIPRCPTWSCRVSMKNVSNGFWPDPILFIARDCLSFPRWRCVDSQGFHKGSPPGVRIDDGRLVVLEGRESMVHVTQRRGWLKDLTDDDCLAMYRGDLDADVQIRDISIGEKKPPELDGVTRWFDPTDGFTACPSEVDLDPQCVCWSFFVNVLTDGEWREPVLWVVRDCTTTPKWFIVNDGRVDIPTAGPFGELAPVGVRIQDGRLRVPANPRPDCLVTHRCGWSENLTDDEIIKLAENPHVLTPELHEKQSVIWGAAEVVPKPFVVDKSSDSE